VRPAWAADTFALRPLGDDETAELLDALPESLALDGDARGTSSPRGKPLSLEQLAAHRTTSRPSTSPASLGRCRGRPTACQSPNAPVPERARSSAASSPARRVDARAGRGAGSATELWRWFADAWFDPTSSARRKTRSSSTTP
jgi:hypothetical protein